MPHDGHDHAGGPAAAAGDPGHERRVLWAMIMTGTFMVAEVFGGIYSGSLALIADAAHMLTDFAALTLAFIAFRVGRRPADGRGSYGYERFQVLAAFVNGIALFVIAGWIAVAAIERFFAPVEILGGWMMAVAVMGLLINLASYMVLRGGRGNLNIDGAALHVMGDLLGSVAAIGAAAIILLTGWTPADPLLSVVAVVLILRAAWTIVVGSADILLERTPAHLASGEVEAAVRAVPGVADVHHVHVWALTGERPIATLHVRLGEGAHADTVLSAVHRALADGLAIGHATVQIETDPCHAPDHEDGPHIPAAATGHVH